MRFCYLLKRRLHFFLSAYNVTAGTRSDGFDIFTLQETPIYFLMESFVFENGYLHLTTKENTTPLHHIDDCATELYDVGPHEEIITPGFKIKQDQSMIECTYPNNKQYFTAKHTQNLTNVHLDGRKLLGLDEDGHAHIYPFDSSQATKVALTHKPQGWIPIPHTSYIMHWDVLSHIVTHTGNGSHSHLRGHYVRVLCADASTTVAVSGDRSGRLCIWFVASWSCHHTINTGQDLCQIALYGDKVAARGKTNIQCYDTVTGTLTYQFQCTSNDMQWCSFGLVILTNKHLQVYRDGQCAIKMTANIDRLIKASHNYVWGYYPNKLMKIRFTQDLADWHNQIIDWVESPSTPCPDKHWPNRYMPILSISAPQWLPHVNLEHMPKYG